MKIKVAFPCIQVISVVFFESDDAYWEVKQIKGISVCILYTVITFKNVIEIHQLSSYSQCLVERKDHFKMTALKQKCLSLFDQKKWQVPEL